MNVLWRSLARMSAKLIFLLSVAGSFNVVHAAELGSLPSSEAVKEPHFLDFRLCKINNLQVKNCQFWEFFYSL
jgi:hypothetical protein